MSLCSIILKNDLNNVDSLRLMSIIQEYEKLYDTVSIIDSNLTDGILKYCKKKGVNIICEEYSDIYTNLLVPLSYHIRDYSFSFSENINIDEMNTLFCLYVGTAIHPELIKHSKEVAEECYKLGELFSVDPIKCYISGLLHDVGGIIDIKDRAIVAESLGLELFDEENEFPLIIHQKLSSYCAQIAFKIESEEVLQAIKCHTTLRKNYSLLDLIVFVADKIHWDQKGEPPYLNALNSYIKEKNLEGAAKYYIDYIMANGIKVYHPWIVEAKECLNLNINY